MIQLIILVPWPSLMLLLMVQTLYLSVFPSTGKMYVPIFKKISEGLPNIEVKHHCEMLCSGAHSQILTKITSASECSPGLCNITKQNVM